MRTVLLVALLGVPAASAASDALDVEEARRIIVETLGDQALPSRADGWSYTMEGEGDEARLLVEMSRRGPAFRFVRGERGWRLGGMEIPEASEAPAPDAGAGTTVLTLGPDDDVASRVHEARRAGADALLLRFTGPPPAVRAAPEPTAPQAVPAPSMPEPTAPGDRAERVTRDVMERLAGALGRRKRSEGRYPSAPDGATIDELEKGGDFLYPFYLRRVPRADGWERPIIYTAGRGGTRYELRSGGPDGEPGTGDDIVIANGRFRAP